METNVPRICQSVGESGPLTIYVSGGSLSGQNVRFTKKPTQSILQMHWSVQQFLKMGGLDIWGRISLCGVAMRRTSSGEVVCTVGGM